MLTDERMSTTPSLVISVKLTVPKLEMTHIFLLSCSYFSNFAIGCDAEFENNQEKSLLLTEG
jgi:hypothetical protein